MNEIAAGAAAGAAATVPMTWAMEVLHRLLPQQERYALPPREVTDRIAAAAGLGDDLSDVERFRLALVSHVGFGATVGVGYAVVNRLLPGRPLVKGTAYGLAVWAGSYLGLLPALGLLTPATRHPPRRNALMIAAHAVWGSAVGVFADLLEQGTRGEALPSFGTPDRTGGSDDDHAGHPRVPDAAGAP